MKFPLSKGEIAKDFIRALLDVAADQIEDRTVISKVLRAVFQSHQLRPYRQRQHNAKYKRHQTGQKLHTTANNGLHQII